MSKNRLIYPEEQHLAADFPPDNQLNTYLITL